MERVGRQPEHEARLLKEALAALTRVTGLKTRAFARQGKAPKRDHPDMDLVIENAGQRHHYVAEFKAVDRTVTLAQVKQQLAEYEPEGILVTPYLTTELARYCREKLDLQFIDTAGNAYVRAPGLYVYIRGEREPVLHPPAAATRGGGTATALRVVFVLLCKPDLLNAPYRDIVVAAGVALGTLGWVFHDLERRGLVVAGKKKGQRRVLDARRLMAEWVTNYPIRLRPKLVPRRFRAANADWWQTARLQKHRAVWGGEVAADRLTENREPGHCMLYMPGDPGPFIIEHKLRADADGDVEILHKFWHFEPAPDYANDLAPPLLVYADLMATPDPRNHETAKQIYDRFLADAPGTPR